MSVVATMFVESENEAASMPHISPANMSDMGISPAEAVDMHVFFVLNVAHTRYRHQWNAGESVRLRYVPVVKMIMTMQTIRTA